MLTLRSFSITVAMGKFSAYKLPLKSLAEGVHEFDYTLDKQFFANMEYNDVRDADLAVHLTVTHRGDLYRLLFEIVGTVSLLCDRCLDDLILPIDTSYEINVQFGDDYNDDSDDLLIIPRSDNDLNVAYMLFDTVVLQIPLKHVHPMGQCNRAMSALLKKHRAGADAIENELLDSVEAEDDAPTDPRWDALRGLSSSPDSEF